MTWRVPSFCMLVAAVAAWSDARRRIASIIRSQCEIQMNYRREMD
ncbi:hypothetical protein NDS46_15845 [Paenibacillus thiaminolyticus]|nr:hypothetical protein [Paenibacillus thiaminolyticus]WCF05861.1 hypothetical protein NDS46_15845 [Paenibacillus thiaminolyticus]